MKKLIILFIIISTSSCVDCEGIKEDAAELRADYEECSEGDSCMVVDLYAYAGADNCLGPFQCSAAFNADSDMEEFEKKARELADDFDQCDECTMAGCMSPDSFTARCNSDDGVCELVEIHYPSSD